MKISEIFKSIQGEGTNAGKPSIFLRTAECNLKCTWCDTKYTWDWKNFDYSKEVKEISIKEVKERLEQFNLRHLVITGGEPLVQQPSLLRFMQYMDVEWGWVPRIDFETNATIMPDPEWVRLRATFTTSPKLANNGDPEDRRYKPEVLDWHSTNGSGFKFVVNKESDLDEIFEKYIEPFDIPTGRIWLMPCCGSRDEHIEAAPMVAEMAKKHHFNFSPRLHLLVWDMALKV